MRIPSSPISAYVREVSRTPARAGSLVDLTTASAPSPDATPLSGPKSGKTSGTLRGVLTPEEERFIEGLFGGSDGTKEALARGGRVYSHGGRPISESTPGVRMDLKA